MYEKKCTSTKVVLSATSVLKMLADYEIHHLNLFADHLSGPGNRV